MVGPCEVSLGPGKRTRPALGLSSDRRRFETKEDDMGDRGIVVLEFNEAMGANIGIYTHWAGSDAFNRASSIAESKNFRSRLGDETYAARIFIDQFTKDERDAETGYGVFPLIQGADPSMFADGEVVAVVSMRTGDVST